MELPLFEFEIRDSRIAKNETTATADGRGAQREEKQGNTGKPPSRQGVNGVLFGGYFEAR